MSFNQSKADKSESHLRKPARSGSSGNQRVFSGNNGGGKGGGSSAAPPPSSANRNYKKTGNGQAGPNRVTVASSNSTIQNGAHPQPSLPGAPAAAAPRTTRALPKAPTSAVKASDAIAPAAPPKGDMSNAFSLQFGSINAGVMNEVQIPARTSSAPPNLDEQKQDQARHSSFRPASMLPIASTSKQQQPMKDVGNINQSNIIESHSPPQAKRDLHVTPSTAQKPAVLPVTGMSMANPFLPQVSVSFGGPKPQISSQGVPPASLQKQMPLPLPVGSTSQVQQQVFVPSLQSHPLQSQGMMPQGQGLSFAPQIPHSMPPQMGSMIGIPPQYQQQQAGTFVGTPRKPTVKITHPDTHEELRLNKRTDTYLDGGSSGSRSHPNVTPQSQPIPYNPHYYSMQHGSYNSPPMFFPPPTTNIPLTGPQMTTGSQGSRYNYPVAHVSQNISFMNPSATNPSPIINTGVPMAGMAEPSKDARSLENSSQVTVKPSFSTVGERVGSPLVTVSSPVVSKGESPKISSPPKEAISFHPQKGSEIGPGSSVEPSKSVSEPLSLLDTTKQSMAGSVTISQLPPPSNASSSVASSEESGPVGTNSEGRRETSRRSDSFKDPQKMHGKKDMRQSQLLHQEDTSGSSISSSLKMLREVDSQSENIEALLASAGVDSSTSISNSLSRDLECSPTSTKEGNSDASKGEGISAPSGEPLSEYAGALEGVDQISSKSRSSPLESQLKLEIIEPAGLEKINLSSLESSETKGQTETDSSVKVTIADQVSFSSESHLEIKEGSVGGSSLVDKEADNLATSPSSDSIDAESAPSTFVHENMPSTAGNSEDVHVKPGMPLQDPDPVQTMVSFKGAPEFEGKGTEAGSDGLGSISVSVSKDKHTSEPNRAKSNEIAKGKKRKDILKAADAAGPTFDLYTAYKDPAEKQETAIPSEVRDSSTNIDVTEKDVESKEDGNSKAEPDDWEDAADVSTPNLKTSIHPDEDGSGGTCKKYSRDFLLTFSEQCIILPVAFEIPTDIAESLISDQVNNAHADPNQYPNSGRSVDRTGGGLRPERRGSGMIDDGKWSKSPGSFGPGRDSRQESFHGGAGVGGFRPGQGGNHGVLRNPRGQSSGQYAGGILSGPMVSQGVAMQRNSPDADRWLRATGAQKGGLIPSPQTPLQVMHKAERKYEVGKVSDEEQAKQRLLKGVLNKLTPQNFMKLFEQVKEVNIDNTVTLTGVISQIFDKALMEPTFCEMYANFCFHLSGALPDFSEDNEKITFKRLLLNKCQEEFERGVREQEEANRVDDGGEIKCSAEEREEKKTKARRRMLGNIRLIGELYKKKMLTERIMHECIKKLLGQFQNPDEEDIEALCKLMSTIGEMIDHQKAREHMDAYFDMMFKLSNNMTLSSRVRFMLKDSIDLRKNKWQQRRKVEGPKKIDEVHRDAAHERQVQASRLARGPSISSSARRGPPSLDFSPRASSMMSSPNSQMGSGLRGLPTHGRGGYAMAQDVRMDERHPYENRMLSVPLSQRPSDDDSITLGPQGGLARGMSIRGQPPMHGAPLVDMSSSSGESRRIVAGSNGFRSASDRGFNSPREEVGPRYTSDKLSSVPAYDQLNSQERRTQYGNRDLRSSDRPMDRSVATSPATRTQGSSIVLPPALVASEKVWSEEHLRDMSIAAIREFYSTKDEGEVALCIRELNFPTFYPSMISLWVTDSFERKDMERDLLAKLLVNLIKSQDSLLNQVQLIKGFESVLATLEDAVNDAPKAAEFLGQILAKVIIENVVPLRDIGRLVHEGGEEPGRLLEVGLASEVLGSILEIIKLEKGETVLNEIRTSSNLQVKIFRPPKPVKWRKLDAFI
ncbi:hypothetical protein GIB67_015339 [Kingdonia uniflora]|uniref:Eukaryotic translation initiation factor 4G n=1 Tax=Kingdonia uniflora TaxID=39325 RepID=A0A7J7KYN9_9MAGN|nr:hypothetical protein GIB67_015339 [Kingdonia uniflora]